MVLKCLMYLLFFPVPGELEWRHNPVLFACAQLFLISLRERKCLKNSLVHAPAFFS